MAAGGKRRRVAKGVSAERAAQLAESIGALGIEVMVSPPLTPGASGSFSADPSRPTSAALSLDDEPGATTSLAHAAAEQEPAATPTASPQTASQPEPPADAATAEAAPERLSASAVGATNGLQWLMAGFEMLKGNTLEWIAASALLIAVDVVISMVPVIGPPLSALAYPMLLGGLMLGAHREYETGRLDVACVFEGVRTQPFGLGLLGIVFWALAALPFAVLTGILTLFDTVPSTLLLVAIALILSMPMLGVLILATPLVAISESTFSDALKLAFAGTLRNIPAIVLYTIGSIVLLAGGVMLLGLGIVVTLPIVLAGGYAAFRDVYG